VIQIVLGDQEVRPQGGGGTGSLPGACHHYSPGATGGVLDSACHDDGGVHTRDWVRGRDRAGGQVDGGLADAPDAR